MLGSRFIHMPDSDRPQSVEGIDDLEGFSSVDLDSLTTLDFVTRSTEAGLEWTEGEPLYFDEASGLAIFRVNAESLQFIIGREALFDTDQVNDFRRLRGFTDQYGSTNIFEVATF